MDSNIGLAIQCAGIYLVALLSFFMTRSIKRTSLVYWTIAWLCLSVSLSVLSLAFRYLALKDVFYPIYLLGEYAFVYFFWAGCRYHSRGKGLTRRSLAILAPGVVFAIALSRFSDDFNAIFMVHAGVMGTMFAVAIYALWSGPRRQRRSPGLRVMSTALALLSLDFLHYVPIFSSVIIWQPFLPSAYLRYTSIYDLILETLLGFGTIMVVMEQVQRELEEANLELTSARDKLEVLASLDPLTGALNRRAFHSLIAGQAAEVSRTNTSGWIAIIDVDDLKQLNDSFGHASGDEVIRRVARAIRDAIRPEDQFYRWGGDEYLVIMFAISEAEARQRIGTLNERLTSAGLPERPLPIAIRVSFGLSYFGAIKDIQLSIERADAAMYECKIGKDRVDQGGPTDCATTAVQSGGHNRISGALGYSERLAPSLIGELGQ